MQNGARSGQIFADEEKSILIMSVWLSKLSTCCHEKRMRIRKVLLVNDSGTMRTIQRRCLHKLGIEDVAEAADGKLALVLFGQARFDIVLTDWNMPVMDGLTVLKELRKQDKQTPVIITTT